jgi:hypothetical protein
MPPQMGDNRLAIERFYLQAEVIHVTALTAGRSAAFLSRRTVDRHEVDQRGSRAKLPEANLLLHLLERATKHVSVKTQHRPQVGDPKHYMIELSDLQHGALPSGLRLCRVGRLGDTPSLSPEPAQHPRKLDIAPT